MIPPNHARPHLHDAEKVVQRVTTGPEFGTNPFDVGSNARREVMVEKTFALQQARLIDHVKKIKTCQCDFHQRFSNHSRVDAMTRAGFPAATEFGGMFAVTTLPAPITAPSPISTPLRIIQRVPTKTSL